MILMRQITRAVLFIVVCLTVPFAQVVMRYVDRRDPYKMARLWHRLCMKLSGVRIQIEGTPAVGLAIFLSNHVSHLDIPVLGSLIPMRFVSRQGIRNWPVFGTLATLQDTIFIDNSPTITAMRTARACVQKAINSKQRLVIFPEGTNTFGEKVLPFRRMLLDGIEAPGYKVQPVVIECVAVDGVKPNSLEMLRVYGWDDGISFAVHLWKIWGHHYVDVRVTFLSPLQVGVDGQITRAQIDAAGMAVKTQVEQNLALTVHSP